MQNTFQKLLKLAFIFSTLITGWTSIVLLSNSTFNLEIKALITKMYLNQKNFIVNVQELSLLLVKDANERFSENNQSIIQLKNSKPD
ncbi:hypothetical protein [Prochlorococcus marinus]|uniref:hypothetical protein n=1 Tax=Prochlorococcus marinus TaxID=1219 RepID=UPI0022B2C8DD|nr:hypothetical protein [Prochlorococcus marinus]